MAKYKVEDIRNIALVGHGPAGKTSLADALLFKAKAVDRRGSVDDGTSVSDYDEEEQKRHFSIDTSVLHLERKGKHVQPARRARLPRLRRRRPGGPQRRRDGRRRRLGPQRRRGQHAAHVQRGRQARPGPHARHQQDGRRQHQLRRPCSRPSATPSARAASCSTPRSASAPQFSGVVSVLNPPDKAPAGCPVDLAAARSQAGGRHRRERRRADGEVPDGRRPSAPTS